MTPAEQQTINTLKELIKEVLATNPQDLSRQNELGTALGFQDSLDIFKSIHDLASKLNVVDYSTVPLPIVQNLVNTFNNTRNMYSNIKNFSPNAGHTLNHKQQYENELRNRYYELYSISMPIIAYQFSNQNVYTGLTTEANRISKDLSTMKSEAENLLSGIKAASVEKGVSTEASHFEKIADDHKDSANKWLVSIFASAALTITAVIVFLYVIDPQKIFSQEGNVRVPILITEITLRIIVFTVLFFIISLSASNYKAHRHNQIINEHRAVALKTFLTFVQSAVNPEIKEAILLQASQCAFAPITSGYTGETDQMASPNSTIVEIMRKLPSGSTSNANNP